MLAYRVAKEPTLNLALDALQDRELLTLSVGFRFTRAKRNEEVTLFGLPPYAPVHSIKWGRRQHIVGATHLCNCGTRQSMPPKDVKDWLQRHSAALSRQSKSQEGAGKRAERALELAKAT